MEGCRYEVAGSSTTGLSRQALPDVVAEEYHLCYIPAMNWNAFLKRFGDCLVIEPAIVYASQPHFIGIRYILMV